MKRRGSPKYGLWPEEILSFCLEQDFEYFFLILFAKSEFLLIFAAQKQMVDVAQSVRASDCGSEGRRFEPDLPPL